MHVISLTTSILKNDRRNLVDLLNDMAQKGRAGVARLPPAGGHGGSRVLYLVPPSNSSEYASRRASRAGRLAAGRDMRMLPGRSLREVRDRVEPEGDVRRDRELDGGEDGRGLGRLRRRGSTHLVLELALSSRSCALGRRMSIKREISRK